MTDTARPIFELTGTRVFVAGHRGMVGSALVRRLSSEDVEIVTADRWSVDLRRQAAVEAVMDDQRPDVVFIAAARVGGIAANDAFPAEFLYDNLMIEANVIEAARRVGTQKLVLLGSTCIYPKHAPQPMPEEALLTGPLEPTNEWYAIAKIAGIKLCQAYRRQYGCDFISAQPTNLYGPGDNFDLETSHVLPALMRKAHEATMTGAPTMTVWGSGTPRREFLHVDDCADALVFLAGHYSGETPINLGTGEEVTIRQMAEMIAATVGYDGELVFDKSRPDGTPRKLADTSRLHALGWRHAIALKDGLAATYDWYRAHEAPQGEPMAARA
ncbi:MULTISPECIES: GDP-L-fucose synthase [unclassified Roseitalea]|uniref:GDP-L-fucose synthase n=1 Tax=unclassified Roseitalea TaxID=2639107 RepID=UPI00273D1092|nr:MULTISPECIES: GDP-L-fucose synthase [unclassified Roseitalea]